ncbi:MAG: phycobiliprotein lyase [Cyanobacteria bacterium P01_F01_bin.42]
MDAVQTFHQFFDCCVGHWETERTYHYLTRQHVERSHTEFDVYPVDLERKQQVLTDNAYGTVADLGQYPGYHLAFQTVSETGEKVAQALNMLFVFEQEGDHLVGDYLRDRAYAESSPMIAKFRFDPIARELRMQTTYTRIVSVDTITLINPSLRIRKILNYYRPEDGQPLNDMALVGFGVEQKS